MDSQGRTEGQREEGKVRQTISLKYHLGYHIAREHERNKTISRWGHKVPTPQTLVTFITLKL